MCTRSLIAGLLLLVIAGSVEAKQTQGKVTYIAAGAVYVSLGTESGVRDSSLVYIVKGRDTVAVLRVFAVSSKSSAASIIRSRRKINVGDIAVAEEEKKQVKSPAQIGVRVDTNRAGIASSVAAVQCDTVARKPDASFVKIQGRVSAQYFTTRYWNANDNISQPAIALNLRGTFRDVPLTLDAYGYYRSLSYGNARLFSSTSIDQSRIYRLSLQYRQDGNSLMIGRFVPADAPTIGYIDGLMVSRKFDAFLFGTAVGYQSRSTLNGLTTAYKKLAVFGNYQSTGSVNVSASAAYTRNYFHFALDREAVSMFANIYSMRGWSLYANGELDLRKKSGESFLLSPSLTSAIVSVNVPVTDVLSLSAGGDVSRPFADFSMVQFIADSLLDRTLRSGINVGFNLTVMRGLNIMETYMPRSAPGRFGGEYTNTSSMLFNNILSSGVMFRTNYTLSSNQYTSSNALSVNVERNVIDALQVTLYYQRARYTLKSIGENNISASFGGDLLWLLSQQLSLVVTYNRLDGFGRVSKTIFTEFSYRF